MNIKLFFVLIACICLANTSTAMEENRDPFPSVSSTQDPTTSIPDYMDINDTLKTIAPMQQTTPNSQFATTSQSPQPITPDSMETRPSSSNNSLELDKKTPTNSNETPSSPGSDRLSLETEEGELRLEAYIKQNKKTGEYYIGKKSREELSTRFTHFSSHKVKSLILAYARRERRALWEALIGLCIQQDSKTMELYIPEQTADEIKKLYGRDPKKRFHKLEETLKDYNGKITKKTLRRRKPYTPNQSVTNNNGQIPLTPWQALPKDKKDRIENWADDSCTIQ